MNLASIITSLSIFHGVFVIGQRLQPFEMLEIIKHFPNISNSKETKECLPMIKGEYHPEKHYEYAMCDSTPEFIINHIEFIYNLDANECPGYQCWESILTDASKIRILDIFNSYRQKVARGICNSWCENNKERLIFRLLWDFHYEYEAAFWMMHCTAGLGPELDTTKRSFSLEAQVLKHEFHVSYKGEFFHTIFKVETGSQKELRDKLITLLDKNLLSSWDKNTKQFRRGIANSIGCVYIVRHNVTLTTDLNEHVKSGNVAHFGCFIAAYFKNSNIPFEKSPKGVSFTAATTSENCAKIDSGAIVRPNALYPSLCMEGNLDAEEAQYPNMICQPDVKYHGTVYSEVCKQYQSTKNPETWNERAYGYILRWSKVTKGNATMRVPAPECNMPKFPDSPNPKPVEDDVEHSLNFACTLKRKVNLITTPKACPGWSCDDSQLTDETRQYVLNSLNEARHLVAQGRCLKEFCRSPCNCNGIKYCNIVKLRWHWYLETKAAQRVQNCTAEYGSRKTRYENSPFQESAFYEEVSLIFELPKEGQIKLSDKIAEIFWSNGLNDWEMNGSFRRGNAAFIGCAIVVRPGQQVNSTRQEYKMKNGSATHMVCIFVSFDENFISKPGLPESHCCPTCTEEFCRLRTAKNQKPFPYLCSSVLSNITMSCAVNDCPVPYQQSFAWKYFVEGETTIEHRNDTIEYIRRYSPESYYDWYMGHVYRKKNCKILILLFLVTLSALCLALALFYKHYVEKTSYTR